MTKVFARWMQTKIWMGNKHTRKEEEMVQFKSGKVYKHVFDEQTQFCSQSAFICLFVQMIISWGRLLLCNWPDNYFGQIEVSQKLIVKF